MINKGDIVRIKPMEGVSEYLHGLDGEVVSKPIVRAVMKRTVKSNWNPVKVGSERICTIDLSKHTNVREIADSISKKMRLPEIILEKVKR